MLGMANSAFYSFPTRIETLDRAVSVIGLRRVRELVLVTVVARVFAGISGQSANMAEFWEHSVATGILARELGLAVRARNADSFYVPGLLHDIGRLLMYLRFADDMQALPKSAPACWRAGRCLIRSGNPCNGITGPTSAGNTPSPPAPCTSPTPGSTPTTRPTTRARFSNKTR